MKSRTQRTDDGSSLVMVMVFVVAAALVSTAFLTRTSTGFKATNVLKNNIEMRYGTDAGVELGVQRLKQDLASASRSLCLSPFGAPETVGTTTFGSRGFPVTVTCQTLQGFAAASSTGRLYGAAVITTGGAGSLTTQSGDFRSVDGTVYVSGAIQSGDLDKDIVVGNGDFAVHGCTGVPVIPKVSVASGYSKTCTSVKPEDAAPGFDALPTAPPAQAQLTLLASPVVVGTNGYIDHGQCRVFFPGTFVREPELVSGGTSKNFFMSGLYYFANIDDWLIPNNATVIAGRPAASDTGISGVDMSGCPSDTVALASRVVTGGAVTSTGATFVFGDDSQMTISGKLLMNSPAAVAGVPQPNVYTVRAGDSGGWTAWDGGAEPVLEHGNATAQMHFNAPINAYDAPVTLFASQPSVTVIESGVVAKTLHLQASAAGTQMRVSGYSTDPTAGERIVRITSRADGVAGEGVRRTGVATVRFENDGSEADVLSWHVD